VDKFFRTDLERILADWGVDTVIVVGTAAHGAVVHTATGASVRGLKVVAPVDGLSAEDLYTEQMAVQHLLTGPGTRRNITLTTTDGISFRP
jgi:nicotinamidase-related amidase